MLTVGLVRAQPASDSIVCADFDRAGWYTLPTLNLGGATTIEGWVYLNSYTSWSRLADLGNGSDSDNILVVLDNGFPKFQIYSGSTSVRTLEISPQVPLGIWTHVAAVIQDDRTLLLYTNGVLAGSTTASDLPASTARTSNFIGKSNWPADALLDGSVTDVRIWNVARSQAEVQAAMAVGAITGATTGLVAAYPMGSTGVGPLADISGHGYTATAGGSIASYTKLGAGALTNSGVFSGTGGLNVLQGTLTLSGANTYTGGTIVSGGTLLVNGSLAAASTVTVGTGAALGGTGTIGGAVIVNAGGTLAPGADAPGTLTLNSSLTLAGTAIFRLRKGVVTLASAQVAGATSVSAGDTLIVTASGDSLVSGDSFTLFNVTPSGSFAATNLPALTTGLCWTTPDNFRTLTVSKGTPVVTAWPAASAVTYGQTLASSTLTGGSATTAGSFAWTAPCTAPNAGTAAQGVTFTPHRRRRLHHRNRHGQRDGEQSHADGYRLADGQPDHLRPDAGQLHVERRQRHDSGELRLDHLQHRAQRRHDLPRRHVHPHRHRQLHHRKRHGERDGEPSCANGDHLADGQPDHLRPDTGQLHVERWQRHDGGELRLDCA